MVTGLDRREVIQDPNAPKPMQAGTIPLAPIQSPRPSSVSRVGQNERRLAEALGGFESGMVRYVEQKRPEWEIEGMMAYAEGAAEADIVAKGNRYTTAGYMAMKARTANNEWLAEEQVALANDENIRAMDSKSYQKYLKDRYSGLTGGVAGEDTYTKNLMFAMSQDTFPRLVEQQIRENNKYREQQTESSFEQMVSSTILKASRADATDEDKQEAIGLLMPGISGIKDPKKEREIVSNAITNALDMDSEFLYEMVKQSGQSAATAPKYQPTTLKDAIGRIEAGVRDYDAVVGNDTSINPSTMTLGQIKEWQKGRIEEGATSVAVGRYQIIHSTLKGLQEQLKLDDEVMFNAETQELMADELIRQAGGDEFRKGKLTPEEFVHKLSKTWAAIPKDASNKSYYEGKNGNKALTTFDAMLKVVGSAQEESQVVSALTELNFDIADIKKIRDAGNRMQQRKVQSFDETRLEMEGEIQSFARQTGNLADTTRMIRETKEQYGLTDDWAMSQYKNAQGEITAWKKEQEEVLKLQTALNNSELSFLSQTDQDKAFEMAETMVTQSAASLPEEQREQAVREHMIGLSITNGVVHRRTQNWIRMGLNGDILTPEGQANENAILSYKSLVQIYSKDPKLADEYAGEHKALFYEAMANDARSDGDVMALTNAARILQQEADGLTVQPIDMGTYDKSLQKRIDASKIGFWDGLLPTESKTNAGDRGWLNLRNWRNQNAEEWKRVKNDTMLRTRVEKEANSIKRKWPQMSDEAAMNQALSHVMNNAQKVAGNVILPAPKGRREFIDAAGLGDVKLKDNTIHAAVIDMLTEVDSETGKTLGEELWGDAWNRSAVFEDAPGGKIAAYTASGTAIGAGAGLLGGPFAPVSVPVGAAVGTVVGGVVGTVAALDGDRVTQSIYDKWRKYPEGLLVSYNHDTEMLMVSIPLDKEKSEFHEVTAPIPASRIGSYIKTMRTQVYLPREE